jgi:ribosomal protein S18 acetylase RimI-like enzyme
VTNGFSTLNPFCRSNDTRKTWSWSCGVARPAFPCDRSNRIGSFVATDDASPVTELPRGVLRLARHDDLSSVILVWHRSKKIAYPYLPTEQTRTLSEDSRFFVDHIVPRCGIWVFARDSSVLGFLALAGHYVDRLYVDPEHQGTGIGSSLLIEAKRLVGDYLCLHTHQENTAARTFYERRGFRPIAYGVSPPPESSPDVEYRWDRDVVNDDGHSMHGRAV